MNKYKFLIYFFPLLFCACRKDVPITSIENDIQKLYKLNEAKITITEGIAGTLTLKEGNCMPTDGPSTCKEYPVQRTIKIYKYTSTPPEDSTLIAATATDKDGFYQVQLQPSQYAVFIIEKGKLYGDYKYPAQVNSMKISKMNLRISYVVY